MPISCCGSSARPMRFAQVPVADFHVAVTDTVTWLKDHKIDVILVGLRYARTMAHDLHYQAIRAAIDDIAKKEHVLQD